MVHVHENVCGSLNILTRRLFKDYRHVLLSPIQQLQEFHCDAELIYLHDHGTFDLNTCKQIYFYKLLLRYSRK